MRTIVRRQVARKRTGISRTTEHRLIRNDPTWPRIVELTAQLTGYFEDELDAWLEARPRRVVPAPDADLAQIGLEGVSNHVPVQKPERRGRLRSGP
jgi:predicted DNA-binding transcriptional regulator AlpA